MSIGSSYLENNSGNNRYSNSRLCSDEGRSTKERFELRSSVDAGPDEVRQSLLAKLNSRNRLLWIRRGNLKLDAGSSILLAENRSKGLLVTWRKWEPDWPPITGYRKRHITTYYMRHFLLCRYWIDAIESQAITDLTQTNPPVHPRRRCIASSFSRKRNNPTLDLSASTRIEK